MVVGKTLAHNEQPRRRQREGTGSGAGSGGRELDKETVSVSGAASPVTTTVLAVVYAPGNIG